MDIERNPGPLCSLLNYKIHPVANAQVAHRPCLSPGLCCQQQQCQSRISYSRNQLLSFHSMGKLSCTPMLLMKLKSMDILRYHGNRSGWLSKARSMRNGLRIPTTSLNWSHYRFLLNIWSVTSLLQSHEPLCYHCGGYCANNWITIRLEPPSFNSPSFVPLVFSPLNSWSISDKSSLIKNFIANHDIDLCALTKTWLRGNDSDLYNIRDICPDGYVFYHAPRLHSSGEELVLS